MNKPSATILTIDDEAGIRRLIKKRIEEKEPRTKVIEAGKREEALELVKKHCPEVVICDLALCKKEGPASGLRLIAEILAIDSTTRVIALTAHDAELFGIKALHAGAASFINKPAQTEHLLALTKDAMLFCKLLRREKKQQIKTKDLPKELAHFLLKSPCMEKVLEEAIIAARSKQSVLILGETGTGKTTLGRAIHLASKRQGKFFRLQPHFQNIDLCASELFGHKKGSFTGAYENKTGAVEIASKGTLLIDEVDTLPSQIQVMLLNVLQEKYFRPVGATRDKSSDFRLISTSNQKIEKLRKIMREDFFHRIAGHVISIPTLKDRKEDIIPLAEKHLFEFSIQESTLPSSLDESARAFISNKHWPGNIRELFATIETAAIRAQAKSIISAEDLLASEIPTDSKQTTPLTFHEQVNTFKRKLAEETLKKYKGNQSAAARALKIDRSSFRKILTN